MVTFSPNTTATKRQKVCRRLGVHEAETPGKYHGMPIRIGKNKVSTFGFLQDRIEHKLQGWGHQ